MRKVAPILFLASLFFLSSCANKKKIIYFQGDKSIGTENAGNFKSVLKTGDLISIIIMGKDAEAVKPFNLSTYGQLEGQEKTAVVTGNILGYRIDATGDIEFPVIGRMKMAGLTRAEASEIIKMRLKDYLNDAIVNIQILNYKFTILGDVNKPGTYTVPNERITLVEAIGLAGDLNMTGKRKNVLVIRDDDGKKTETRIDLTTKEVFNSPVYYLQQNDVVYVEPNRSKKNSSVFNTTSVTLVISVVTLFVTLTTLLKK